MSASAAARGLSGITFAEAVFRRSGTGENTPHKYGSGFLAESIANVLRHSGHTVAQLSILSGQRYGSASPYFIPPTFLYKLRSGVTPHICQIATLSECTGYRFLDWMRLLGFDLNQIPRLQVQLHPERTVLVTPVEFEGFSTHSRQLPTGLRTLRESSRGFSLSARLGNLAVTATAGCCFVKIGHADAMISPQLFPGMIVSIDCSCRRPSDGDGTALAGNLWLLEQSEGLMCTYLKWIDDRQVVLVPSRHPWGSFPLHLSREARVLGLLNLESASMRPQTPQFEAAPVAFDNWPSPLLDETKSSFSGLLRRARSRTGLTFRAAHQITRVIARIMGNPEYSIGLGLLSDYEAMNKLPRHIAKIISLCIVYCLDIRELLEAAGVYIDDSSKMPLPHAAVLDSIAPFGVPSSMDSAEQYRTVGLGGGRLQSFEEFRRPNIEARARIVS
jgi:hypothetical protein